jgi:hypothetical protein
MKTLFASANEFAKLENGFLSLSTEVLDVSIFKYLLRTPHGTKQFNFGVIKSNEEGSLYEIGTFGTYAREGYSPRLMLTFDSFKIRFDGPATFMQAALIAASRHQNITLIDKILRH